MDPRKRMLTIKLAEEMKKNESYAKKLGLTYESKIEKKEGKSHEK